MDAIWVLNRIEGIFDRWERAVEEEKEARRQLLAGIKELQRHARNGELTGDFDKVVALLGDLREKLNKEEQ